MNFNNKNNNIKKKSNIFVNQIQSKNPIIKDFFFYYTLDTQIKCDFKVADKFNCFFLSLKYHELYPSYIEEKLNTYNQNFNDDNSIKYLLCLVDLKFSEESDSTHQIQNFKITDLNFKISNKDYNFNIFEETEDILIDNCNLNEIKTQNEKLERLLTDLNFICINKNIVFILCYSGYDIAQFIYSLSQMDNISFIEDKMKINNLEENILEILGYIDTFNKNDASSLISNFQDIKSIFNSNYQILSLIPGMTNKKIKSLEDFLKYDFKHMKVEANKQSSSNIDNN